MVSVVSQIHSSVFPNILSVRGVNQRLSAPVPKIHAVYARFKHINGIPSSEGGIPVLKLRMLDNLIDNLLNSKEKRLESLELNRLNTEQVDSLIDDLQVRLRRQVLNTRPVFSGFYPETGMLLNLVA